MTVLISTFRHYGTEPGVDIDADVRFGVGGSDSRRAVRDFRHPGEGAVRDSRPKSYTAGLWGGKRGLAPIDKNGQNKKAEAKGPGEVIGGDDGVRTHDLRLAKPALSQLSYVPFQNKRPSGDSAHAGAFIVKDGGPDKARTCDLPVISRTL